MAKNVEVLLRDNVKNLGKCGDVVKVSPGYARNFLLPRRIAIAANDDNKKAMVRRRALLDVEEAKRDAEVQQRVDSLNGIMVMTKVKADEHGHLYGSVNAANVVELLARAGHPYEEKSIRMEPIKEVGTHAVKIHVHGDRYAEVKVVVEAESAG